MKYFRVFWSDRESMVITEKTKNEIVNAKTQWVTINTIGYPISHLQFTINKTYVTRIEEDIKVLSFIKRQMNNYFEDDENRMLSNIAIQILAEVECGSNINRDGDLSCVAYSLPSAEIIEQITDKLTPQLSI